jgi:nucleoside-diphosphate-sugar epimerase
MKLLIIGGSGLLGSFTAAEAGRRGHEVSILTRGRLEAHSGEDEEARRITGDVHAMGDSELGAALAGQDAIVYSLGIDDRQTHRRPAYAEFHEDHVTACLRVLRLARAAGAKKFLVFGSYFTYFENRFPELGLAADNIYIRTRNEQRQAVLAESGPGFDTYVLELPYILGSQKGRVPPWTFIFSMLSARGKRALFFTKGGTAAVTARQVAQAALGALETGRGGRAYPLGGRNYLWTEFAQAFFRVAKLEKKLLGLPQALFRLFGSLSALVLGLGGRERGLNLSRFAAFQYREAFVDGEPSMRELGYGHDDYEKALDEVIKEWLSLR